MAALTPTMVTKRLPVGDRFMVTARVTPGNGAADEWIASRLLGLSLIDAIVGHANIGTATGVTFAFRKNARGTGVAEGTNKGDLGVEASGASTTVEVTVIGKA